MSSMEQVAAGASPIRSPVKGSTPARRALAAIAAVLTVAALAAMWRAYAALDAGADYPEPWAQVSR